MAISAPTPAVCTASTAVLDACKLHWPMNADNCSGFIRSVAEALGIPLAGDADTIVGFIDADNGWFIVASGADAVLWAEAGYFVVGGLKGGDQAQPSAHGHVVVVVPGPLAHGKYPTAWWGSLGSTGKKDTTINYAWAPGDRDKVIYRAALPKV